MTMSGGVAPPLVVETAELDGTPNRGPVKVRKRWGRRLLTAFAVLLYLWLFAPLINIVIFTFNKPAGRRNLSWNEFTLDNWAQPFKDTDLTSAFLRSLLVAAIAVTVALILGSLMAIALARYRFTGSKVMAGPGPCGSNERCGAPRRRKWWRGSLLHLRHARTRALAAAARKRRDGTRLGSILQRHRFR